MKTINYNPNIDFINYMLFVANLSQFEQHFNHELKKKNNLLGKSFNEDKKLTFEKAENFHKDMSYIQKNYLDLFFKDTYIIYDFFTSVFINGHDLQTINNQMFIDYVVRNFGNDIPSSYEEINQLVKAAYDAPHITLDLDKTTNLVMDIMNNNDNLRNIVQGVQSLQECYFNSISESYQKAIEEEVKAHQKIYDKDPSQFLSNLTNGQHCPKETTAEDMRVFYASFAFYTLSISIKSRYYVYSRDILTIKPQGNDTDLIKPLLKFLSDPKRYEMIKMLKQKKWYANELAKAFHITPATMSYHVNKLYDLELVRLEPGDQNRMYIILDKEKLAKILNLINEDLLV